MRGRSTLLICRAVDDLRLIDEVYGKTSNDLIVASDSVQVQDILKNDSRIKGATYIDQMHSVFSVMDSVLSIRELVNDWLSEQSPETPRFFLDWIKHAEGGWTTQRIQDALLLIDSYSKIIDTYNVVEVSFVRRIETEFEDGILRQTASSRKIGICEFKPLSYEISKAFDLTEFHKTALGKVLSVSLPAGLYYLILKTRLFYKVLKYKIFTRRGRLPSDLSKVVFIAESNHDKAINDIIVLSKEFKKHEGFLPVGLLWNGNSGRKKVMRSGITAYNLESWFPLSLTQRVCSSYSKTRKRILKNIAEFERLDNLKYRNVDLGKILLVSMRRFIEDDLLKRFVMYYSAENFFSKNYPCVFRSRGDFRLDLDIMCYESLKKAQLRNSIFPFIFTYQQGADLGVEYYGKPAIDAIDLYFVWGEVERRLNDRAFNKTETILGSSIFSSFFVNGEVSRDESLNILGIPNPRRFVCLYVSSFVANGLFSSHESSLMLSALISYANRNRRITLLVKPHPSEDTKLIYSIIRNHSVSSNVEVLDKSLPIFHCVNVADLVIHKHSTVAYEAMRIGRPVICFSMDREKRFLELWKESCDLFYDSESLVSFLDDITQSDERFDYWARKRRKIQREYISKRIYRPDMPIEKYIVDNVISRLEHRRKLKPN
jgi:hypothetical protein